MGLLNCSFIMQYISRKMITRQITNWDISYTFFHVDAVFKFIFSQSDFICMDFFLQRIYHNEVIGNGDKQLWFTFLLQSYNILLWLFVSLYFLLTCELFTRKKNNMMVSTRSKCNSVFILIYFIEFIDDLRLCQLSWSFYPNRCQPITYMKFDILNLNNKWQKWTLKWY